MDALYELLITLLIVVIKILLSVGLLFVMLISVVYVFGYIYDSIFGNVLIIIGKFIGERNQKIKSRPLIVKLWEKIQPQKLYIRYETPLFTYCFSYTAISLLTLILPIKNSVSIIVASALYLLLYFVGMARKCGRNKKYYNNVLDNNLKFLKLSFLPLGFIITVIGFFFTITGAKVQELPFDFTIIEKGYTEFVKFIKDTSDLIIILKLIVLVGMVFILFYVISLPIQVVSYFVISVIKYFRAHKTGYIELFKKFFTIIKALLKCFWK